MSTSEEHVVLLAQHHHAAHLTVRVAVRDRRQSLPVMASLVRRLANARPAVAGGAGCPVAVEDAWGAGLGDGSDAVLSVTISLRS